MACLLFQHASVQRRFRRAVCRAQCMLCPPACRRIEFRHDFSRASYVFCPRTFAWREFRQVVFCECRSILSVHAGLADFGMPLAYVICTLHAICQQRKLPEPLAACKSHAPCASQIYARRNHLRMRLAPQFALISTHDSHARTQKSRSLSCPLPKRAQKNRRDAKAPRRT